AGIELGPTAAITAERLLARARAEVAETMARCAQDLLAAGVDLRQYNSVASAADLVALMGALGYDTYNLYGISYGTRLALVTMREYPRSGIRGVVLDSTYPPGLEGFEQYPVEPHEVVIQLFADCFLDPVCNDAYPDLTARFIRLLDQLEAEPLAPADDLSITAADVVEVMQGINGMVEIAPYVPLMIHELERGQADTFLGIVTGSLFAGPAMEDEEMAGEAPPAATPVDADTAAADELTQLVDPFLAAIGATDAAGSLSPAQAFLGEVLATAALPEGQANELTVRLFLLDKLPETRATLRQFVDRAFADPALAASRDSLLGGVANLDDADIAEVFANLSGPLQLLDTTNVGLNSHTFNSVECNESVPFQRFEHTVQTAVELEIPELGLNLLPGLARQFATREVWPSGRALDRANEPVASNIPALILAGVYDLQTPVSWNKEAFVHLPNAGLLIFPMSGHGVITFSQCAADVTAAFIENPIYYPDSSCIADLIPNGRCRPRGNAGGATNRRDPVPSHRVSSCRVSRIPAQIWANRSWFPAQVR
ncbi:MAG: alpha/beta hydrolase, partial [Chloroflexota bacterium]|nr:alpha/beta hydrolase [Chloroflexota bacterium]